MRVSIFPINLTTICSFWINWLLSDLWSLIPGAHLSQSCPINFYDIQTFHFLVIVDTAQKLKFSIKYFFSKCDQIHSFLRIWSHLLKRSLMENFIFCAVWPSSEILDQLLIPPLNLVKQISKSLHCSILLIQ